MGTELLHGGDDGGEETTSVHVLSLPEDPLLPQSGQVPAENRAAPTNRSRLPAVSLTHSTWVASIPAQFRRSQLPLPLCEVPMAAVNSRRVLWGALAGGVVWNVWSVIVNAAVLSARYQAAQKAGAFLKQPRYPYPLFIGVWIVMLFVLAFVVAWLYASARASRGAGPKTAAIIGLLVGFAAGFPTNFATATWAPISRHFPLWWMLELWIGAIFAALVAGWLYQD